VMSSDFTNSINVDVDVDVDHGQVNINYFTANEGANELFKRAYQWSPYL
jgi:hypothetical protein